MQRVMVFDLETNALALEDITRIHVLALYDSGDDKFHCFDKEDVRFGVELLGQADVVVGHNVINFDIPVIQKFFPDFKPKAVLDTLVWARLAYPDIKDSDFARHRKGQLPAKYVGRHSLESYGYRLGILKDDFHETADWSEWSEEMSEYCVQDVRVTKALYERLVAKNVSPQAIELEHKVAHLIKRQTDRGFAFNQEKAQKLYLALLDRKLEIERELKAVVQPWYEPSGRPVTPKVNNKKRNLEKGSTYQKIKRVEFNPGSRQHVAKFLQRQYGWKPKEFTDGGQPKIDDEVLKSLPYPEAEKLAEYFLVEKRIGQLAEGDRAWMKLVKSDGRIHGDVITNGAVTGRMTHNNPNVAQVPRVGSPWGKECRELFEASPGYVLVGCDASSLELRCFAHYVARWDGGEYAQIVTEGDVHTANQEAAGLPTRDMAKTFIYGFLYGAGDAKIGSIVGKGKEAGRKLREKFLQRLPAINKLRLAVEKRVKERGYLIGLDGRHLKIRSQHSALNTLLQSAGALVMKQGLVLLDERLQSEGLVPGKHYEFVANIHDEWQIEALPEVAEKVGKTAVWAIEEAGRYFNFRCPLTGEFRIGNNWAETH